MASRKAIESTPSSSKTPDEQQATRDAIADWLRTRFRQHYVALQKGLQAPARFSPRKLRAENVGEEIIDACERAAQVLAQAALNPCTYYAFAFLATV